jgi:hypothetical protein
MFKSRLFNNRTQHEPSLREWVMLHIILMSTFYPPKIDVALKITIRSKFNNNLS